MRIVLDTNVFISALLWRKECFGIFKLAMRGKITICISREILLEFGRVLLYPRLEKQLNKIDKKPLEIINELLEVVDKNIKNDIMKIINNLSALKRWIIKLFLANTPYIKLKGGVC